jgi:hypothetical protein
MVYYNTQHTMSMASYKTVKVVDDRINIDAPRFLVTDEGPSSSTYQVVTPADPASLNPVFTVQLPSNSTGLNRKMMWRMQGSLTITGTNLEQLQYADRVAFRQFPIQSACTSVQVQVNDSTVSIGNLSQIISGLLRKGVTSKSLGGSLSDVNCAPDLTAEYDQAMGATGIFEAPGNAPYSNYTSQSRCQGFTSFTPTPAVSATSMVIQFDIQEPIVAPPFEYGDAASQKSIFGLNTLQISANLGNFHRMLSIALAGTAATISSVALAPTVQQLQVNFVTPKDRSLVDPQREYLYGFTQAQSFISTLDSGTVAAGATTTGSSNVVDLSVVPKGFLVWASYSEVDRANASQSLPDVCFPIQAISCSFMTRSGLLAGATADQLYQMNVKNGVSYPAWAHHGDQLVSSGAVAPFPRGAGGVLYIDCAGDLSLPDGVSPGMAIRSQFSIDSITTLNPSGQGFTAPRLFVVALTDGLLSNKGGSSSIMLGGVKGDDDSSLKDAPTVMRSELTRLGANGGYGGGFWDSLKKVARAIIPALAPVAAAAAPQYASIIEPGAALATKALGGKKGAKSKLRALMDK